MSLKNACKYFAIPWDVWIIVKSFILEGPAAMTPRKPAVPNCNRLKKYFDNFTTSLTLRSSSTSLLLISFWKNKIRVDHTWLNKTQPTFSQWSHVSTSWFNSLFPVLIALIVIAGQSVGNKQYFISDWFSNQMPFSGNFRYFFGTVGELHEITVSVTDNTVVMPTSSEP